MQTILLSIIAGLLIIRTIDIKPLHFQLESYMRRMFVTLYYALIAGVIVWVVAYLISLVLPNFNP